MFKYKVKKEREEFSFPKLPFDYDHQHLKNNTPEQLIILIDKFDGHIKECEKAFNKSYSNYEECQKKEKSATDKLHNHETQWKKDKTNLEDDLKQMKAGFQKHKTQNEEYEKVIKLLKAPVSKKIEDVLEGIHKAVFQITKNSTADKGIAKNYEDAMAAAENALMGIENQLETLKNNEKLLTVKVKGLEKDMEVSQKKISDFEKQVKVQEDTVKTNEEKYTKSLEDQKKKEQNILDDLEDKYVVKVETKDAEIKLQNETLKERADYTDIEVTEIKNKKEDLENQIDTLQIEYDKVKAQILERAEDLADVKENFEKVKKDLEVAHMSSYQKDAVIAEKKSIFKKMVEELKTEKRNITLYMAQMKLKDDTILNLRGEIEESKGMPKAIFHNNVLNQQLRDSYIVTQNKGSREMDLDPSVKGFDDEVGTNITKQGSPGVRDSGRSIQYRNTIEIGHGIGGDNMGSNHRNHMGNNETPLIGSGGQEDQKDSMNNLIIEYSIKIEDFKNHIDEQKEKSEAKDEKIESIENELDAANNQIKDLERKRVNAKKEIDILKERFGLASNLTGSDLVKSTDMSNRNSILFDGKNLRDRRKTTLKHLQDQQMIQVRRSCQEIPRSPQEIPRQSQFSNINEKRMSGTTLVNKIAKMDYSIVKRQSMDNGGLFLISPEKLEKFIEKLNNELKRTYMIFVEMVACKSFEEAVQVEKGLTVSMTLSKAFTNYVDEKLEAFDLKQKPQTMSNLGWLEDVFKDKYDKKK